MGFGVCEMSYHTLTDSTSLTDNTLFIDSFIELLMLLFKRVRKMSDKLDHRFFCIVYFISKYSLNWYAFLILIIKKCAFWVWYDKKSTFYCLIKIINRPIIMFCVFLTVTNFFRFRLGYLINNCIKFFSDGLII